MILGKIYLLIAAIFFSGCGMFGGDEMTEAVSDKGKTEGSSETQSAPENTADQKHKKSGEEKEEKGFFSSISSILPGGDSDVVEHKDEDSKLQIARLIARVEELSSHVIKMQSRLVILEKSVHLGISPESMNSQIVVANQTMPSAASSASNLVVPQSQHAAANNTASENTVQPEAAMKSSKFDDFQNDLSKAISLFKKGEYGSAYVSFNNIDASYTENVKQGLPTYWIARSWYRLREFQSAKKYFETFVRQYPTSIQAPMAKYYLAKIDVSLGMPGSAISLLQEVIREHPNGNAADASRKLIGEMNKTL